MIVTRGIRYKKFYQLGNKKDTYSYTAHTYACSQ
jgi:hypothetical protein